ncbi:MAG: CBS domain-containing protein [Planctomycetes bacterium]|nr:CBS domain-containing protein [Planctomycetota bacterium]
MFDVGLGTLVTYNPTVVAQDATLDIVEGLFKLHDIRHAPVVDGQRRVVGIVSLLDVQRARNGGCYVTDDGFEEATDLCVSDVMQSPVVTVRSDDTPLAALQVLLTHGFHSVPVVTDEKLVGIVTSSDFLRELSYGDDPLFREPLVKHILSEKAQIDAQESLMAAGRKMESLGVDHLAVVSGGLPLGYVSRRDLMIATPQEIDVLTCGHVANTFHATTPNISMAAKLGEGVRILLEKHVKVAMVVDRQQRSRGLLTVRTALAGIAGALEHEHATFVGQAIA